jgi:outer membrane protein TolC
MGFTQLGAARVALEQQQAAEAAARRAYASAEAAARRGEISRDTLRAAELSRIEAEDALTAARLGVAQAVLACQRALGGG